MKTEVLYQTIIRVPELQHSAFSDRLTFAMSWRDCSVQELSRQVYVGRSTIRGYQSGHRTPDLATLIRIAAALNISTDFLLGRIDYICVD